MSYHILISGAGIGGLSAAIALILDGHKVTVLEKTSALESIGAGIQLSANATKLLKHLGVLELLADTQVQPKRIVAFASNGANLFSAHLGVLHRLLFGGSYLHVHRADLQQALLARLNQLDPNALVLGADISGFSEKPNLVSVFTDQGQSYEADCLIAADGIKSIIRQQLFKGTVPVYSKTVAWRGLIDKNKISMQPHDNQVNLSIGNDQHFVSYYVDSGRYINFIAVTKQPELPNEQWLTKASWTELKQQFSGWHLGVEQLLNAVDERSGYCWALHHLTPLQHWSSQRITLLGDAAHACLPFVAQGSAMAIEDAVVLQRSLAETSSVTTALAVYEYNRKQRTAKIQQYAQHQGELYHGFKSKTESGILIKPLFGLSAKWFMSKVYGYNALKTKLIKANSDKV